MAEAKPLGPVLKSIMEKVNSELDADFNGILINHYKSGEDYISAHSDDESNLSENAKIASLSFGSERIFRIRRKWDKKIVKDAPLPENSLTVMSGMFQKVFTHEVPKSKKITEPRWSLTFRTHKS